MLRGQLVEVLIGATHLAALFWGQACPFAHALLNAALFIGFHVWIALGNAQPFLAWQILHAVPVCSQGSQNGLLRWAE
ncbi:hypothetical protein AT959_03860 [Dechloromonas denitrificans]|uniref:Uncharacterized protein n=1 Tax=Dechloromonas denitrificans TaxID=281362 RepID=A0A133XMM8_9RHOO|nr:hypothetical protein AT959_03860 [Dechloromonas denitrificans]